MKKMAVWIVVSVGAIAVSGLVPRPSVVADWDWNGVIGTGQSLAVGGAGLPIKPDEPRFGNLKVDTGDLKWPVDPDDPKIGLAPLVEPVGRRSAGFPSSWPMNIDGETAHTSAASQISQLVQDKFHRPYVTVHFEVGESGQGMVRIRKEPVREGVTGRSYEAAMIQTKAVTRLAKAAKKSFGVSAVFLTHGETDTGNAKYEEEIFRLWSDYNADVKAITGQKRDVVMLVSQHNRLGDFSPSTIAQWKVGKDHGDHIACIGPKYQYPYSRDALHLTAEGYRLLGEKYGEVYFERVVLGHRWRPLEPDHADRRGKKIVVAFHAPVGPLVWDSKLDPPHPSTPEWSNGKGFEVTDASGKPVKILEAKIVGANSVELELEADAGPGAKLSYALVGEQTLRNPRFGATPHWGLLRDSDPFVGSTTHVAQPNYCVAFEMPLK